jgi:hypothetical protein
MDTIGRSLGVFIGSMFVSYYELNNVASPYGMAMMTMTAIFGVVSALMVLPLMKTWNKDYAEVQGILNQRAEEHKKKLEEPTQ